MNALLEVNNIDSFWGTAQVLWDISLEVETGKVVALLGRNGAGKTTTLRNIIGLSKSIKGSIKFKGQDVTRKPAHERAKMGMSYMPDNAGVLHNLTCLENLRLTQVGFKNVDLDLAFKYFPSLRDHLRKAGRSLSGGEQRMLGLARACLTKPELMLLDEPTSGLSPGFVKILSAMIKEIRSETSLLLVEENIPLALSLSDKAYILVEGKIVFDGPPDEARSVAEKYIIV